MTNFQFISDLLNTLNALFEASINGCNIHETRCYLDELFDKFEEHEGTTCHAQNSRGDLELVSQLIANLHEVAFDIWLAEEDDEADADYLESFFPNLKSDLNALTIFSESKG